MHRPSSSSARWRRRVSLKSRAWSTRLSHSGSRRRVSPPASRTGAGEGGEGFVRGSDDALPRPEAVAWRPQLRGLARLLRRIEGGRQRGPYSRADTRSGAARRAASASLRRSRRTRQHRRRGRAGVPSGPRRVPWSAGSHSRRRERRVARRGAPGSERFSDGGIGRGPSGKNVEQRSDEHDGVSDEREMRRAASALATVKQPQFAMSIPRWSAYAHGEEE